MEQEKIDNLKNDFQKRLIKRIEARKINVKEQLAMAGNISGTGILASVSMQGFPAYAPAFAGLFAFSVALKVYNIAQAKKTLLKNIELNEYQEDFITSNLSVKEYMKSKNLTEDEQKEFIKSLLPNRNIEEYLSNAFDAVTGEDIVLEAQVDHMADNYRKKIKP